MFEFQSHYMRYCQNNEWKTEADKKKFDEWCERIGPERLAFVDKVYLLAQKHYTAGGDIIIETFTPYEVEASFKTIADMQEYCDLKAQQALNARWGSDDDPQLKTMQRFEASGDWSVD